MNPTRLIERIDDLFGRHGCQLHAGSHGGRVTVLQHALQCAQLAEWAHAHMPLVGAALLHDIGHLLAADGAPARAGAIDELPLRGARFLSDGFGPELTDPVKLHEPARRYLARADHRYLATLPPLALRALQEQGGPMRSEEAAAFESHPHAMAAVQLCRWDDLARVPGKSTPPLDYYMVLLEQVLEPALA
jgi:predicted HD phosphohydrolase